MRPLVIGAEQLRAIAAAIERAAKHPVTLEQLKAQAIDNVGFELTLEKRKAALGENWQRQNLSENVLLPFGYRAAISFEYQPIGLCRHLSVSVDRKGKLPSPEAVDMIAKAFGCEHPLDAPWLEEFSPGHVAVNIVALNAPETGKA